MVVLDQEEKTLFCSLIHYLDQSPLKMDAVAIVDMQQADQLCRSAFFPRLLKKYYVYIILYYIIYIIIYIIY